MGKSFVCAGFLFGMAVSLVTTVPAQADDVQFFVIQKQEKKALNRWSLQEWLETRDRMRLMDLWLAMHSPSPYEFFVGGNYQFNTNTSAGAFQAWEVMAAAYATIFGLEFHRDSFAQSGVDVARYTGQFNFRIFGYHAQGTNITLHGGIRHQQEGASSFRNLFAGASMNLYLAKFFGVEGLGRYYFTSTPTPSGDRVAGFRFEAGAFIDFKFVRVYGDWFIEPETRQGGSAPAAFDRSGVIVGTKLFF